MPSNADSLIKTLNALSDTGAIEDDPEVRMEALRMSRELCISLQDPGYSAMELAFAPLVSMSARIAIDLDLFSLIDSHNGPVTASQLAARTGAEEQLIIRILRSMTASGIVKESGVQAYESTPMTKAMAGSSVKSGHRFIWDMLMEPAAKAPSYFTKNEQCVPDEINQGLVQHAYQTRMDSFHLLSTRPELLSDYRTLMNTRMSSTTSWIEYFPVEEKILVGSKSTTPLIVDVGGGGSVRDLQAFYRKFPGTGKLVVQDVSDVMDSIRNWPRAVEPVTWELFNAQPVKGARAYCLHRVFHAWPDTQCITILRQLRAAMEPRYSKLLLHELIMPDTGASKYQAMRDLAMMTFNAAKERSRRDWTELLAAAGFEVVEFYDSGDDGDGIIEAVVRR